MSGYYAVCRFNGAALTHVLPDGKAARKTVCCLREFDGPISMNSSCNFPLQNAPRELNGRYSSEYGGRKN